QVSWLTCRDRRTVVGLAKWTNRESARMNIHEAKSQLSKLVERAEAGEEIIIARAGNLSRSSSPTATAAAQDAVASGGAK
ncbi:MAG: type II toxin-antitoxin system Phd/YefM family antitoxin, partial [Pirellulales bacterium]